MRVTSIQTCRWGAPTLFLPWPHWCNASNDLWSCTRGRTPRGVADPQICEHCDCWEPAPGTSAGRPCEDDHLGSTAS